MFKTFPEFSKLTLNDRAEYEAFIKGLPPLSDISFPGLMIWWNSLNALAVSVLNGNLVISYWWPGNDKASGLSLIGTNNVDESICVILDHLKEKGEPVGLVHVPEFVVSSLRYPEQFIFEEDRDFDEYIVDARNFYPLSNAPSHIESKIVRTLAKHGKTSVKLKSLDLGSVINRHLLLATDMRWRRKGALNDAFVDRSVGAHIGITNAWDLGLQNICIHLGDELAGFMLYKTSPDKKYAMCYIFNFDPEAPNLIELMIYEFSKWLAKSGVQYANVDSDLGLPLLRSFRLKLGPVNFFRKYNVRPT
jgi:hypothetical protein